MAEAASFDDEMLLARFENGLDVAMFSGTLAISVVDESRCYISQLDNGANSNIFACTRQVKSQLTACLFCNCILIGNAKMKSATLLF
jgi:hypothetical protein